MAQIAVLPNSAQEPFREPLIKTKLSAPQRRASLVYPSRLQSMLEEGAGRALTRVHRAFLQPTQLRPEA